MARTRTAAVASLALILAACATTPPLSVRRADPVAARRAPHANALTVGVPSETTRIVLRRRDLHAGFESDPAETIRRLREIALEEEDNEDSLLALAELSFLHASRSEASVRSAVNPNASRARRPRGRIGTPVVVAPEPEDPRVHYLAAAVYAWAYLVADKQSNGVVQIDPLAALAADIYNHALAAALAGPDGNVVLRDGRYPLPWGSLDIAFDKDTLVWGNRRLTKFRPAAEYDVRGLRNRYRQRGIGTSLVATADAAEPGDEVGDLMLDRSIVSATAVLAIDDPGTQLSGSDLDAQLTLYRGRDATSIDFQGRRIPLEIEPSAALAATLEESGVWQAELLAFLGRVVGVDRPPRLFALEPLMPQQIPVVFVHGTNSNPAVWANMANDLNSDPLIRERYSFWFFAYDSGNPILYSGMNLRRALRETVAKLGEREGSECLQEMVVIGHSQGGLLTRLTATDSGTRFWDANFRRPFDPARFRPETAALLQEAVFVTPLPFVERVVFIATPHRGSFLASPAIVRRLAARLIQLPSNLVEASGELSGLADNAASELRIRRSATSLDNMSPGNNFIRTLAEIPIAPGVAENSIVAVLGDGPPEDGDDSVVRFESAHRPQAESELIVRSHHSTQANPHTINEVERILRLHAERSTCAPAP